MAAGKGKRLKSRTPKVLHPVAGRPILWHVLQAVRGVRPVPVVVVVGHGGEEVRRAVGSWDLGIPLRFVDQGEPLGTGHAVLVAEEAVGRAEEVLVVSGDEPLLTGAQLRDLLRLHRRRGGAAAVQTTVPRDPSGFGRVVREGPAFVRIAEESDATVGERAISEVITGTYVFRREDLFGALPLVTRENRQREYYLPDVLAILREKGERVAVEPADNGGSVGANSRAEIADAAAVLRGRIAERLMERGVTIEDPAHTYIDVEVAVGRDTAILPGTHLRGATRIGDGCTIGPDADLADATVGHEAVVERSVVRGARIGPRAVVGPYTHLRPGTVLAADTKAGSFVEIKNSRIGEGSKVPHLAYVGDATIGRNVNIGAGTITVNYDGYGKHRTAIGDDARIGSDTMLVAPVRIGKGAVTGAGSVITKDVPAGALAVERDEQRVVRGYRERKDREMRHRAKRGKA
jgi:bifunctional UDP-N-acetylglucosamine pyrophosphorylase / glucosamine-1-phosphate N-acetyltransferase